MDRSQILTRSPAVTRPTTLLMAIYEERPIGYWPAGTRYCMYPEINQFKSRWREKNWCVWTVRCFCASANRRTPLRPHEGTPWAEGMKGDSRPNLGVFIHCPLLTEGQFV